MKNNGGCDQKCTNRKGSFECSCNDGYEKTDPSSMMSPFCKAKSCGPFSQDCPSNSNSMEPTGSTCKRVTLYCSNADLYKSFCYLICPFGYDLAVVNTLPTSTFDQFIKNADFNVNFAGTVCKLTTEKDVQWNIPNNKNLYCIRLTRKFEFLTKFNKRQEDLEKTWRD